ncbi:hypothetical protein Peur_034460 [Populus x canadensis]
MDFVPIKLDLKISSLSITRGTNNSLLNSKKNHHQPLRPLKQHRGNLGPASQPPLPSTSKSHKIKPIFITSSPHGSVESIPAFSQANGLPLNHKNTPRSLTVINHSSLSQTQKPPSPKTILSNTNHHHHNKHCPLSLSLPIFLS